jgi:hypothetical protein
MPRRPLEDIVFRGINDERQGGQAIRDDIDPQQVERQQRQGQSTQRRYEHHRELGRVAREEVDKRLANVVEDPATLADRGDDTREVIVGQDHV